MADFYSAKIMQMYYNNNIFGIKVQTMVKRKMKMSFIVMSTKS